MDRFSIVCPTFLAFIWKLDLYKSTSFVDQWTTLSPQQMWMDDFEVYSITWWCTMRRRPRARVTVTYCTFSSKPQNWQGNKDKPTHDSFLLEYRTKS
eukprot:scaffold294920_cov59-Attheya_sp.AAC.8